MSEIHFSRHINQDKISLSHYLSIKVLAILAAASRFSCLISPRQDSFPPGSSWLWPLSWWGYHRPPCASSGSCRPTPRCWAWWQRQIYRVRKTSQGSLFLDYTWPRPPRACPGWRAGSRGCGPRSAAQGSPGWTVLTCCPPLRQSINLTLKVNLAILGLYSLFYVTSFTFNACKNNILLSDLFIGYFTMIWMDASMVWCGAVCVCIENAALASLIEK